MAKRRHPDVLRDLTDVAKALSDPSRVRILRALRGRELCVCQIVELLELAPSTISKHMSILRQADLVESRKDGRWVHYRRSTRDASSPGMIEAALGWLDEAATGDAVFREDERRLRRILKLTPEELCRQTGIG